MSRRSLFRPLPALTLATVLCGCGGGRPSTLDDYVTRGVKLPDGKEIRAEVMLRDEDMAQGMMFRDALEPDHGMLFMHRTPGTYQYWMYQVRIPLDIIWMNRGRQIVEISAATPPCPSKSALLCPTYGGKVPAQYVLELGGGMAAKHGLKVGDQLDF